MTGKIIKGIAGFYYVYVEQHGLYECKAKGIFRNQKVKPLVGDDVSIDVLDEDGNKGNITGILPRDNELIRPAVANVDQAVVIFAAADPAPNLNLLDRFLVLMLKQQVDTIICFNKRDIVAEDDILLLEEIYKKCGYRVIFTSTYTEEGLQELKELLKDKTSVVAGPSGVGKSSIVNKIQPKADMETGEISDKIKRGKHNTRHSEIIYIQEGTYICDTPGFSSLYVSDMEKEELKNYFMEFREYEDSCRFQGCVHINEPGCAVKDALKSGKISGIRYENYSILYEELKNVKKY